MNKRTLSLSVVTIVKNALLEKALETMPQEQFDHLEKLAGDIETAKQMLRDAQYAAKNAATKPGFVNFTNRPSVALPGLPTNGKCATFALPVDE